MKYLFFINIDFDENLIFAIIPYTIDPQKNVDII